MAQRNGREMTIFCVDVSPSMANQRTVDVGHPPNRTTRQVTNLEYGLEVVKARVMDMLLAGLKTVHCGIVLFGSDVTQNSLEESGYPYIWEYMNPAQPSPATLTLISDISVHLSQTHAPEKGDLLSALILCDYLLGETLTKKKWKKKIVMITDAASETNWKGSKSQRDRMEQHGIHLTVIGLDFDDPKIGYIELNKPETKSGNERRLHKICESLTNGSTCTTALLAILEAHTPRPRVPGTMPVLVTLSIGALEPEQVIETTYEPAHTLRIECHLRKCTNIVRPKPMKKMSRLGIKHEQAKARRMNGPSKTGEELDQFMAAPPEGQHDEEEPSGLLQTERKYVYAAKEKRTKPKEIRKLAAYSDSNSEGSDSSSGETAPLREADKDQLVKAYRYGATLVVMEDEDFEEIRENFEPSLQIRGFLRRGDVPRHHLLNDVNYLIPSPNDARSQLAFSAVVRALDFEGLVALARYVGKSLSAEPKMVVLIPIIEEELHHFLMIQLPFAEDLREYFFPSLETVRTSAGKELETHKNLPTEQMQRAMDEFVDIMAADDDVVKVENEDCEQPWPEVEQACSPAIHYMNACLSHKLSRPDSEDLPPIHPSLKKWLEPPPHLKKRATPSLERLKSLLDVKPVAKRIKTRRKFDRRREDQSFVDPDIDLTSLLGGAQARVIGSQNGHVIVRDGDVARHQKPIQASGPDLNESRRDGARGDRSQIAHANERDSGIGNDQKPSQVGKNLSETDVHRPQQAFSVKTESSPSS